jgi:protein-L-isoaspartate O-methyltransferase
MLTALDLRFGHTVLDVGCGPGTDLADLAAAVGVEGMVIGVVRDPGMAAEAGRHVGELHRVCERAWRAGAVGEEVGRAWLGRLAHGSFLASFVLFTVVGEARARVE